jgi:hypothetical protein
VDGSKTAPTSDSPTTAADTDVASTGTGSVEPLDFFSSSDERDHHAVRSDNSFDLFGLYEEEGIITQAYCILLIGWNWRATLWNELLYCQ